MKTDKCLNPACEDKEYARGLCKSCYQSACYLVSRNMITWEELVITGKAHETHRGGGTKNWLLGDKNE